MVAKRIFLAGASGVVGIRLIPMLRAAGYEVFGTTRDLAKAPMLERAGATPVIVDVFDAEEIAVRMTELEPAIVMHQLTDLPRALDPARMPAAIAANARIRGEGTRNLVAAARYAGAKRIVAQSIAWAYAPGPLPHEETDPLDTLATGMRATTVSGVVALEDLVMDAAPIEGIVLRYGHFYGPDTGVDVAPDPPAVHVDAAAHAALLATRTSTSGIFNVADDSDVLSTAKAKRELGWHSSYRIAP